MRPLVEQLEQRQFLTTVPNGFIDSTVITGLDEPTAMVQAPDGRIFVAEQNGDLRVIQNNVLLPTPVLTLTNRNSQGERGFLGVELDPNFASNGYIYTYYTSTQLGLHNHVTRWTVNGNVADPTSELLLFDIDGFSSTVFNHMGGGIHFGTDGKLYIATGEATNPANSQSLSTTLGKILRINSDGSIPTDNPFYGSTTGNNRAIYALGFRNPFTFAVQPGTGRIFVNDVGASTFEEINDLTAGGNYGWDRSEGPATGSDISPVFYYGRATGQTIAGGAFYNPTTNDLGSSFVGKYFYADAGSGIIRYIDPANSFANSAFATGGSFIVDLDITSDGKILYLERGNNGRVGLISSAPPVVPNAPTVTIKAPSAAKKYVAGTRLNFAGNAFDIEDKKMKPFTFAWSVDFVDSGNTVTNLTTRTGVKRGAVLLPNTANSDIGGKYRITLTVTDSSNTSTTVTRELFPKLITISLTSNVAGARYTLDGVAQADLTPFTSVAGIRHTFSPIAPPDTGTETYAFRNWSGGSRQDPRTLALKVSRTIKMNFSVTPIAAAPLTAEQDELRVKSLDFVG